jgi:hypothetical protein
MGIIAKDSDRIEAMSSPQGAEAWLKRNYPAAYNEWRSGGAASGGTDPDRRLPASGRSRNEAHEPNPFYVERKDWDRVMEVLRADPTTVVVDLDKILEDMGIKEIHKEQHGQIMLEMARRAASEAKTKPRTRGRFFSRSHRAR